MRFQSGEILTKTSANGQQYGHFSALFHVAAEEKSQEGTEKAHDQLLHDMKEKTANAKFIRRCVVVFRLSPPHAAHSCTRLAIRSGQSHAAS